MSNEDLLAGLPAAPATKKRGKFKPIELVPASTSEVIPEVQGGANDAGVNATDIETPTDVAPPEGVTDQFTAEQEAKFAASMAELDAKTNSLTPVSVDYTLAMANRISIVGGKREYSYNRLLRQGKSL